MTERNNHHEPFQGKTALVGCGALGALYGCYLHRGGANIHFLSRSDHDVASRHGYTIITPDGSELNFRPPVHRAPHDIGICDLVIIGMKATDNDALAGILPSLCDPATLVLTLQNGIGCEELIASLLHDLHGTPAEDRLLGAVAFLCSNRIGPARIHHQDQGWIHLAEHGGPATARTHQIAEAFRRGGVPCEVFDSLPMIRWQKLAWNIPFNSLSVLANRADTRQLLDDDAIVPLIRRTMDEAAAIAACEGVELDPAFLRKLLDVTEGIGRYRTSMLLDFEAGRPLEVDAILGEPLRRARRHGLDVPCIEMLHALLRRWSAR